MISLVFRTSASMTSSPLAHEPKKLLENNELNPTRVEGVITLDGSRSGMLEEVELSSSDDEGVTLLFCSAYLTRLID